MNILRLLLLSATLGLAACGTTASPPPSGSDMASVNLTPDYTVGPDDTLEINVWDNPNLSVSVPVRPDGKISMPLIGDVLVGGLTPEEVSTKVEVELLTYVKSPNVSVIITNLQSNQYLSRVRVTGAVITNISVPHRQGMTVMDVILEAGGVNEYAAANKTQLYRNTAEGRQSYTVLLDNILRKGDITTNYALAPGDIITVPERIF